MKISGINFVERIDMILKEKKKTRKEFAMELNIQPNTMGNWKTNNSMPPIHTIVSIAEELNVSIDYLVTGREFKIKSNKAKETVKNNILSEINKLYLDIETYL